MTGTRTETTESIGTWTVDGNGEKRQKRYEDGRGDAERDGRRRYDTYDGASHRDHRRRHRSRSMERSRGHRVGHKEGRHSKEREHEGQGQRTERGRDDSRENKEECGRGTAAEKKEAQDRSSVKSEALVKDNRSEKGTKVEGEDGPGRRCWDGGSQGELPVDSPECDAETGLKSVQKQDLQFEDGLVLDKPVDAEAVQRSENGHGKDEVGGLGSLENGDQLDSLDGNNDIKTGLLQDETELNTKEMHTVCIVDEDHTVHGDGTSDALKPHLDCTREDGRPGKNAREGTDDGNDVENLVTSEQNETRDSKSDQAESVGADNRDPESGHREKGKIHKKHHKKHHRRHREGAQGQASKKVEVSRR